jgi:hypothetical protein
MKWLCIFFLLLFGLSGTSLGAAQAQLSPGTIRLVNELTRECVPFSYIEGGETMVVDSPTSTKVRAAASRIGIDLENLTIVNVPPLISKQSSQESRPPKSVTVPSVRLKVGRNSMTLNALASEAPDISEPVHLDQFILGEWQPIGMTLRGPYRCPKYWVGSLVRSNLANGDATPYFEPTDKRSWTVPIPVLKQGWYRLRVPSSSQAPDLSAVFRVTKKGKVLPAL